MTKIFSVALIVVSLFALPACKTTKTDASGNTTTTGIDDSAASQAAIAAAVQIATAAAQAAIAQYLQPHATEPGGLRLAKRTLTTSDPAIQAAKSATVNQIVKSPICAGVSKGTARGIVFDAFRTEIAKSIKSHF